MHDRIPHVGQHPATHDVWAWLDENRDTLDADKVERIETNLRELSSELFPLRVPRWAIDLDGTLITDAWPDLGVWLPGAIDALREIHDHRGGAVIHTVRISPLAYPWDGTTTSLRDPADVQFEYDRVRKLLDDAGFEDIAIWEGPGKPPAAYFVDDRGFNFNPKLGWRRTMRLLPRS